MGIFTTFGSNQEKEKEGTWVDIVANDDGAMCSMKVARAGGTNTRFQKELARLQKKFRSRKDDIATQAEKDALVSAFVDTVLLDWKNVEDNPKDPVIDTPVGTVPSKYIPFSRDNAKKVFAKLPELFEFIYAKANDLTTFQDEANEDAAKN